MNTAIGVTGIVVSSAVLLIGIRKPDVSTAVKSILSVLELAVLIVSVVLYGWLGFGVFLAAIFIGLMAWSFRLYIQKESLLTSAAVESNSTKEEMEELFDRARLNHESLRVIGPIGTAKLIKYLAQRARSIPEMEQMVDPIAKLHLVFEANVEPLVEKFDRALRLYGSPASDSMRLADTLTASTQAAAATFEEMLDALIAAATPE